MMYEELIKRCRCCLDSLCGECKYEHLQNAGNFVPCMNALLAEAADAIEKLSAYVRQIEELRKEGYYLQKTKMMTYGQATMTMPLPEPPKEE